MQTFFGWKPILLLCCAAFSIQLAHSQNQAEANGSASQPESRSVSRTLADLGHGNGIQQSGPDSSIDFVMPMPLDTAVTSPRLVLHYAVSTMAAPESSMRVSLNGSVRQVVSLSDDDGSARRAEGMTAQRVLSVPLNPEDLRLPFLDVSVQASFSTNEDRCVAPEISRDFVRVMPQTSLSYRAQPELEPSVRGFLSTLPTNARIAIAPRVTDEALRASWVIARELQTRGHRVTYSHPEEGGDILIGPRAVLAEYGAALPDDADLGLVAPDAGQPYRFQLVVTDPYHIDALAAPWNLLLGAQEYTHSTATEPADNAGETLYLARLGVNVDARAFTGSTEWALRTSAIPAGRSPSALRLNLVVPPSTSDDPLVLYVLQNATVRGLATLPIEGGEQSLSIALSEARSVSNDPIRIALMRQSSNDCTAALTSGYVQMLDTSVLETTATSHAAESVIDFGRTVSGAYSVHLPEGAAEQPLAWARTLSGLGRALDLDPRMAELRNTSMPPPDNRPFIWFGEQPPQGFDSMVAIDRGRIQVQQSSGEVLLDSGAMPALSMISLLRNGSRRGLWLRTLGDGIPETPPGLERSTGDLVFGDREGVLVSLATRSDTVVGVEYPDHGSWVNDIARYRIWLFALAWILLTIVVIAVARRMRKNQK